MELWVAGFPSRYGGADTELDHQIDLFRAHDVDVHLVPMFSADPEMRASVEARGCTIHTYRDDLFADRIVLSWCNGNFLDHLAQIRKQAPPRLVVWFNCMTYPFEAELKAHHAGLIDRFGFVSDYQRSLLEPALTAVRPLTTFGYQPWFNAARVAFRYREWQGTYCIGRISRDDASKYAPDTWRIFDRVLVPPGLAKKVFLLGHGPQAAARIGRPPAGLDWLTWGADAVSAEHFYRSIDTLVHKTGGSRESYCRVVVEAYAHGVVPIVEDDYAFPELVIHGETGFRTSDSDEMSWYASWLAHHPEVHARMAIQGREHLERVIADRSACWAGWRQLLAC